MMKCLPDRVKSRSGEDRLGSADTCGLKAYPPESFGPRRIRVHS
jgi:hypothetical protein